MGQTDRPDDRRAAGSRLPSNSESAVKRNHETPKSGIPKRKKIEACPRLSCKIQYLLASNHSDQSTASKYFTDDYNIVPRYRYRAEDDRVDPCGGPVVPVIRYGPQEETVPLWLANSWGLGRVRGRGWPRR